MEKLPKGLDNWMETCLPEDQRPIRRSIYLDRDPQSYTEQERWRDVLFPEI